MDPIFISHLAQQAQQRLYMLAQGKKAAREAEMLKQRRELLVSAQQHAEQLVQESSIFPQRVYVQLHLFFHNLEYYGVVPESFEDTQERESVILLWRKLSNLSDKINSRLTPDDLAHCRECLDAMFMERFLQTLVGRLQAYEEYQQIKPTWESLMKSHAVRRMMTISIIILLLASRSVNFIVNQSGFDDSTFAVLVLITLIVSVVIGFGLNKYLKGYKPRDLQALDRRYHQLSEDAQIEDQEFWQAVKDKFNGIPSREQIKQSWDEQETKIRVVFGEPATSPSSGSPEASPSDQ